MKEWPGVISRGQWNVLLTDYHAYATDEECFAYLLAPEKKMINRGRRGAHPLKLCMQACAAVAVVVAVAGEADHAPGVLRRHWTL